MLVLQCVLGGAIFLAWYILAGKFFEWLEHRKINEQDDSPNRTDK